MKRWSIISARYTAAVLAAVMAMAPLAHAADIPAFNINYYQGYFSGYSGPRASETNVACGFTAAVQRVLCHGVWDAIPGGYGTTASSQVVDKVTYENFVINLLSSSDSQERMGAAFIIYTSIGRARPASGTIPRPPTATEIQDFKDRIDSSQIQITFENIDYTINSGYAHFDTGAHDDVFMDESGNADSLVFTYTDPVTGAKSTAYQLKAKCANPVGIMSLPPPVSPTAWVPEAKSFVKDVNGTAGKTTAVVGDTIHFTHTIGNTGNEPTPNIAWTTYINGTSKSTGTLSPLNGGSTSAALPNATGDGYTVPAGAPVGSKVCAKISYKPGSKADLTSTGESTAACVTIVSNYDLYPKVSYGAGDLSPITPGSTAQMTQTVYDNAATADRNSHYEVQQFTIPAAATKPTTWGTDFPPGPGAMSGYRYKETNHVNDAACAWMQSAYGGSVITACDKLKSGDTTFNAGLNTIDMTGVSPIDASAYNPGDWVCRIVSISLYRYNIPASGPGSSEPHRVTYPICVVIAKMPSVQIIGDDLHVGDGPTGQTYEKASVQTGSFEAGSALYGSWVEYGIFAPAPLGVIKSISGGVIGGPNGGTAGMTDDQKNGLSFANTASPYGNWSAPQEVASIEKMAANYPEEFEHGANINLNNKVGDNQIKRVTLDHAGGVKMSGDFTRQDAAAIFIYDGTVTIDGNINVTDKTINAIGKASQVVIIANQIIIKDNVENIDAWLVARSTTLADAMGVITTCNEIQSPYTKNLQLGDACSQHQLRINGAVIAKELQLRRTYGADKSLTNGLSIPAEILDLRADAYMWARSVNASGVFNYPMQTMFTTELPPRF